ncbi:MAG: glucokinase [Microcystaceae cyanobacterium]
MVMLIAGDIGGTKTILRLVEVTSDAPFPFNLNPLFEQTYPSQEYTDLVPLVINFIEDAKQQISQSITVDKACFGIAGPVVNNTCQLTNLDWTLSGERLADNLVLEKVSLINDFAAIGYGILGLTEDDLYPLQKGQSNPSAPIAIIGAGTGLGEGFLIPNGEGLYNVYSSEGGHTDFAPRSQLELDLLMYVKNDLKIDRVSVERIASGQGIASIYQFLRTRNYTLESDKMKQVYQQWEQEKSQETQTVDLSAEVAKAAQSNDYLCQQTMNLFIEAYGTEAGNLALKLLPYGGLYVAGGIAAKNLELMKSGVFMDGFCAKGRMRKLIENIPVFLILNQKVGLIGAGIRASQL